MKNQTIPHNPKADEHKLFEKWQQEFFTKHKPIFDDLETAFLDLADELDKETIDYLSETKFRYLHYWICRECFDASSRPLERLNYIKDNSDELHNTIDKVLSILKSSIREIRILNHHAGTDLINSLERAKFGLDKYLEEGPHLEQTGPLIYRYKEDKQFRPLKDPDRDGLIIALDLIIRSAILGLPIDRLNRYQRAPRVGKKFDFETITSLITNFVNAAFNADCTHGYIEGRLHHLKSVLCVTWVGYPQSF